MKKRITDYLQLYLQEGSYEVNGNADEKRGYYQIFLEAGKYINTECFRRAIETEELNIEICIDVSCMYSNGEYKLLIEVYW